MCPTLPRKTILSDLPQPFVKDIHCGIGISIKDCTAVRTSPLPYSKVFGSRPAFTTMAIGLAGSKEPVHGYQLTPIPFSLEGELSAELTPCGVRDGFCQLMVFYHIAGRKVLNADYIILAHDLRGQLVLHIPPLVCDVLMESGDLNASLIPVGVTLCFSG